VVKDLPAKAEDTRDACSVPGLGRLKAGGEGDDRGLGWLDGITNSMERV